jgi:hypothetical protein
MTEMPKFSKEDKVGKWIVNLNIPGKGKFNGSLEVAKQGIKFVAKFDWGNVLKGAAIGITTGQSSDDAFHCDEESFFVPVEQIESVEPKKKFIMNQVEVGVKGGTKLVFDYGVLSTKKMLEALEGIRQ